MEGLVYVLNNSVTAAPSYMTARNPSRGRMIDFSEMQVELRQLVVAWRKSGPNLTKFFAEYPEIEKRARHGRTLFLATSTGRGHLVWLENPTDFDPSSQKDLALTHFMGLITNPLWELLGGPCARCGSYYLKKRKSQKVYCSTKCGTTATSISTVRARRKMAHDAKLSAARQHIERWVRSGTRLDWKKWVARETGITIHWLTRAINNLELKDPARAVSDQDNTK